MQTQSQPWIARTRFPARVQSGLSHATGYTVPRRGMKEAQYGEGSLWKRLLLVLSSMSPLFVLWAIRGTEMMPERHFWALCAFLFVAPNAWLFMLITRAKSKKVQRTIVVGEADDRRQDIISYLFAMLLPFYTVDLSDGRNVIATVLAFLIVVILFVSLNLHYMNVLAALLGYHCLQVSTSENGDRMSSAPTFMVVTKKARLRSGSRFTGYIISPTLLLEVQE